MPLRIKTMRKQIGGLLMIGVLFFSCAKDQVKPNSTTNTVSTQNGSQTLQTGSTTSGTTITTPATTQVNGYLRLKFAKDSINTDGILIEFNPAAKAAYVAGEDAPSLQGFGVVSLASFSSNNIPLAINVMPLTSPMTAINLRVNAKSDGIYTLNMQEINSIPNTCSIWLMDAYKKDSIDMRSNSSYAFVLSTADTTSFGSHRFKLVLRPR